MKLSCYLVVLTALLAAACNPAPQPSGQPAGGRQAPAAQVVKIAPARLPAGDSDIDTRYRPKVRDPALEDIRQRDRKWQDQQDAATAAIRKRQAAAKKSKRKQEKELVSSLPESERPTSIEQFTQVAHLPPVRQYYTGTCWSFSTTSFMESEVIRKTSRRVKLAEMSTVYYEYLAKAARYLDERGDSLFAEGSESNALTRVWREHGAWPLAAYPGFTGSDPRHDHLRMFREMKALLAGLAEKNLWERDSGLRMLQVILDRHLGRPPQRFDYQGRSYTPKQFMNEVLHIDPNEYVGFVSTLSEPFYQTVEFAVPDNWWHDKSYHNVPLDEFYHGIKEAISNGYSVIVGVDVSEPGKDPEHDTMFIPPYDISGEHIDQLAREYRLAHQVTTDDHGVHLVGYTRYAGHDWFLIKDSGSSAQRGPNKGYYFMRDDYVRLKVLSYMVHRDAVADLLAKFKKT